MKLLGLILVILGILGLIYGGFTYTRDRKVLDIGALEMHTKERRSLPVSPIAGGVAVLVGAMLILADRRRA